MPRKETWEKVLLLAIGAALSLIGTAGTTLISMETQTQVTAAQFNDCKVRVDKHDEIMARITEQLTSIGKVLAGVTELQEQLQKVDERLERDIREIRGRSGK